MRVSEGGRKGGREGGEEGNESFTLSQDEEWKEGGREGGKEEKEGKNRYLYLTLTHTKIQKRKKRGITRRKEGGREGGREGGKDRLLPYLLSLSLPHPHT